MREGAAAAKRKPSVFSRDRSPRERIPVLRKGRGASWRVERGGVAGTAPKKGRSKRSKKRTPRSRRRLRLVWLTALVGVALYLYYQPLASYLETRNDLEARQSEVDALLVTKAGLERRLTSLTSLEATQREARRIGYVLPGEQLFVVKGIPEWRRVQRSVRGDG